MRFMVFVKATEDSEEGVVPTPEALEMFEERVTPSATSDSTTEAVRDALF